MESKEVKTKIATIHLIAPQIVENAIQNDSVIGLQDALDMKTINKSLTEGKPYAILVKAGLSSKVSKEARELVSTKEFSKGTIAKALLITSLAQRIAAQFYIRINKPNIPTKIFSDRDKAIVWLTKQVEKHNG